jgi:hypothetical protein
VTALRPPLRIAPKRRPGFLVATKEYGFWVEGFEDDPFPSLDAAREAIDKHFKGVSEPE